MTVPYCNMTVPEEDDDDNVDVLFEQLQAEALQAEEKEPTMSLLLRRTVLSEHATSFESAVALSIAHRLGKSLGIFPDVCPLALAAMFRDELACDTILELSHTASQGIRHDALAYVDRDPACETLLEAILFFKGFAATVTHRVAYRKWHQQPQSRLFAFWLQSQASQVFGVDIHPAAQLGAGIMMDHATGIVIGECAVVGDGCTLLHGVTLGGTGKDNGDRHPKVGPNVLIGANVQVLGNISIGAGAKIGAGSVVLRPVPHGATAVGSPARIIGFAKESKPAEAMDLQLVHTHVIQFDKSASAISDDDNDSEERTTTTTTAEDSELTPDMMETDRSTTSTNSLDTLSTTATTKTITKSLPALARLAVQEEQLPLPQVPTTATTETLKETEEQKAHDEPPQGHAHEASDPQIPIVANRRGSPPHKPQPQPPPSLPSHGHNPPSDPYCVFRNFTKIKNAPPTAYTYCQLRLLLMQEQATEAEIGEVFFSLLQKSPHPERGYIPAATFDQYFQSEAALRMPSMCPLGLSKLWLTKLFHRRSTALASACQDTVATARLDKWAEEKEQTPPELAVASF
jgi:serine O-acetyltransferase